MAVIPVELPMVRLLLGLCNHPQDRWQELDPTVRRRGLLIHQINPHIGLERLSKAGQTRINQQI